MTAPKHSPRVPSCPSGEYPGEFVDLDRSSPTLGSLTAALYSILSSCYRRRLATGGNDRHGRHDFRSSWRDTETPPSPKEFEPLEAYVRSFSAMRESRAVETARQPPLPLPLPPLAVVAAVVGRRLAICAPSDKRAGATRIPRFRLLHNWAFR